MFSTEFHKAALNVIVRENEFSDNIVYIKEDLFSEDEFALEWFRRLVGIHKEYQSLNESILIEEYGEEARRLLDCDYTDIEEYVKANIRKFVYLSSLGHFIKVVCKGELSKDFRNIDVGELRSRIEGVQDSWLKDKGKKEIYYFDDVTERLVNMVSRTGVPTGWFSIDQKLLGGGLCEGELGIILALPNTGKSATLVNIATVAAMYGKKVLYVTLEMAEEIVGLRFDMRITGMPTTEVLSNLSHVTKRLKQFKRVSRGNIVIKGYQSNRATVRDIRRFIIEKERRGEYKTDFLVVDYADILTPVGKYGRDDLGWNEIYTELRMLGNEFHMPVWTASQSHRKGGSDGPIDMKNFADSFSKGFIGDVVMSINQTSEQLEQGVAYYYMAKNRNEAARFGVDLRTDWSRMVVVEKDDYDVFYGKKQNGS